MCRIVSNDNAKTNDTMSVIQEALPFASAEIAGLNPAYLIAAGALAGAAYQVKKIIPSWHITINESEVGVLLRRGKPVERTLSEEQEQNGESCFKILQPDFYWVPPFRTIQPVHVTDRFNTIHYTVDSQDGPQVEGEANVTWYVSPEGDNPIKSITKVMHQKIDKKESTPVPSDDENTQVLRRRVLGICAIELSKSLTGRSSVELKTINKEKPEEIKSQIVEACRDKLIDYGVVLRDVELVQPTRVEAQVLGELLSGAYQTEAMAVAASNRLRATENGKAPLIHLHENGAAQA